MVAATQPRATFAVSELTPDLPFDYRWGLSIDTAGSAELPAPVHHRGRETRRCGGRRSRM